MRTYGRVLADPTVPAGPKVWVEVDTAPGGSQDAIWVTTLIQNLKLILGESPFFADHGIPAQQAVLQQLFPDFYVWLTQRRFSGYFASLIVAKVPAHDPTYNVNVVTNAGARLSLRIPT